MNSGFGNVAKYLAIGLKKLGHEVTMSGMQTGYCSDFSYGIEQLPIDTKYVDELTQFMININRVDPDVVIGVFQADADVNHFTRIFNKNTKSKFIWYPPVEGKDIPDGMANDLRNVISNGGKVVGQCKYGQEEMKKVGIDAIMIYHGYNDSIFRKMDDFESYCYYGTSVGREESDPRLMCIQGCYICQLPGHAQEKCEFFKEETISILRIVDVNGEKKWTEKEIEISKLKDETKGKWVYGHVGVNFGIRKRQERLIKAYSILINESKQLRDRTILHLHCKPMSMNGVNLIKEVAKLGVSENVIFSYGSSRSNAWTEQAVAWLYNTFDCHVSASSSEGFGLSHLESMACNVPNIAPDCSSLTELIGNDRDESKNRGWLANIGEWQMVQDSSFRVLVDEKDLSLKMKIAYVNKEIMAIYSDNAIKWVKSYTWDNICEQWDKLLRSM